MQPWAAYPKGSLEISVSYHVPIRPRHEDLSVWVSGDTEVLQSDLFLFSERSLKSSSKSPWKLMDKVLREVLEFAATVFHCLSRLGGQPWT